MSLINTLLCTIRPRLQAYIETNLLHRIILKPIKYFILDVITH